MHKHLQKSLPHAHHTSLHNHTIIHMEILTRHHITHTIEYDTNKKL